jgi:hypothetical protein
MKVPTSSQPRAVTPVRFRNSISVCRMNQMVLMTMRASGASFSCGRRDASRRAQTGAVSRKPSTVAAPYA